MMELCYLLKWMLEDCNFVDQCTLFVVGWLQLQSPLINCNLDDLSSITSISLGTNVLMKWSEERTIFKCHFKPFYLNYR